MNASTQSSLRIPRIFSFSLGVTLFFTGCVSNRYKEARKNIPPPEMVNVAFAPAPLKAMLNTLIAFNGPGSWKRDAYWDEYVVTLHNPGPRPLVVTSAVLVDFIGATHAPGNQPWILEKSSKTLEQKYREAGLAFVRYTGPALLLVGAGAGVVSTAGTFAAASAVGTVVIVALPLYYLGVVSINQSNRQAMEREFHRRRLELPLTISPGETRSGSFFFPMVPGPRSLNLHWADGPAGSEAVLPLDFLSGLHLKSPTMPASREH